MKQKEGSHLLVRREIVPTGRLAAALEVLKFLAALYLFLLSIELLGAAFKTFGKGFSRALIESTTSPFVGLFIGILSTSIVQSSSATTSMVVGMVAAGTLTVRNAVPIVMGANIGTTVTNTIVSLAFMKRKEEFRRAMAGNSIHDLFNLLTVAILLPLEMATHYLERSATVFSHFLVGSGGVEFKSPLKMILEPVVDLLVSPLKDHLPKSAAASILLVVSLAILFRSLIGMTRIMKKSLSGRIESVLDRTLRTTPLAGMLVGVAVTGIVQSSSCVTSMLVPLAAVGIITAGQIYPIALGANIGTTVTAILAALATGRVESLTIALTHFLFNVTGILLIYPYRPIRNIPLRMAKYLANLAVEHKRLTIVCVLGVFYVIPGLLVFIHWLLKRC